MASSFITPASDPRCEGHLNPSLWNANPTPDNRIRVTCSICGKFIGYRDKAQPEKPAELPKPKTKKGRK